MRRPAGLPPAAGGKPPQAADRRVHRGIRRLGAGEKDGKADGVSGHGGLRLHPVRSHGGADTGGAGAAGGQRGGAVHELHHRAVLPAGLRRRGPQPGDGTVLHPVFRHDDGGHRLRAADAPRLMAVPEEKTAGRPQLYGDDLLVRRDHRGLRRHDRQLLRRLPAAALQVL